MTTPHKQQAAPAVEADYDELVERLCGAEDAANLHILLEAADAITALRAGQDSARFTAREAAIMASEYLDRAEAAEARVADLTAVVEAAKLFVKEGTRLTVCDRGPCQQVIERKDRSDPQSRLFAALDRLGEQEKGE